MTNRVGPVIMGHTVARAALESMGTCMSFRTSDRTTGATHYRYERTGRKQGDVTISKVSDQILPTDPELAAYRPLSGFRTVDEWQEAIQDVHGDLETPGYVYRIELIDKNDDRN